MTPIGAGVSVAPKKRPLNLSRGVNTATLRIQCRCTTSTSRCCRTPARPPLQMTACIHARHERTSWAGGRRNRVWTQRHARSKQSLCIKQQDIIYKPGQPLPSFSRSPLPSHAITQITPPCIHRSKSALSFHLSIGFVGIADDEVTDVEMMEQRWMDEGG